jgi:hypothetical protein
MRGLDPRMHLFFQDALQRQASKDAVHVFDRATFRSVYEAERNLKKRFACHRATPAAARAAICIKIRG